MHILYLDDSGSTQNQNNKYFVLGGVSIYETQARIVNGRLENLARKVCPENSAAAEFHASEIFGRRKSPWKGMEKRQSIEVIESVLRVLTGGIDAHVFACAVEKESLPENQDPVEIAFEDLCSRFNQYLNRLGQQGLLVLDKSTKETALQKMTRNFQQIGTQWGTIKNLVDVPFFVDSRASRLVQLADHVAYAVFRRYNARDTNYFDIIAPQFDVSKDGSFHGLGHKCKSQNACICPACIRWRIRKQSELAI